MDIRIERACPGDFDRVWRFYADVCVAQAADEYSPDWHLGVYPSRADLEGHIADGGLFIAVDAAKKDGDFAGSDCDIAGSDCDIAGSDGADEAVGGTDATSAGEAPVLGAMVLTDREDDDYLAVDWHHKVAPEDVCVLHLLATHPAARGRGVAKALLRGMVDIARAGGKRAIHLDVIKGNLAASRLYEGFGFRYAGDAMVHYDDIGDTELWMYELAL